MKPRVCVIGAGVIGLPTAVNIIEKFPEVAVTIISEKFSPDTTGDGAAGLWMPYALGNTPAYLVKRWSRRTWDHMSTLLHTEIGTQIGIQLVAGYSVFDTQQEDPDWKDDVFGFRHVTTDELQKVLPSDCGFLYGWGYATLLAECTKYLPWLMDRFQKQGGRVQHRRVNSIGELVADYDVVVNCSGVNALHLVNDKELMPVKGQIIKVHAPWLRVSVMYTEGGVADSYVIPVHGSDFVVLGGTADVGRWDTDIDSKDGLSIYNRCCKLFPGLKKAKIIGEWSGVRPGRTSVRLEREDMKFGPYSMPVVHNYGHGGAGIGLHWGCAEDAAELVGQCLEEKLHTSKL